MNKLIILIILTVFLLGCTAQNQKVIIKEKSFNVEIADTQLERAQGLMFRKELKENEGMLFIFPNSERHSFWMKNTLIPLDIIWINKNLEVVYISKDTQPCNEVCGSIVPNQNALYVLEINSNLTEKYDIEVGDKVEMNK